VTHAARLVLAGGALAGASLLLAAQGATQPQTQQVVLPGPVPYPTVSPPLTIPGGGPGSTVPSSVRVSSTQRVLVGVDGEGRPSAVRVRQRLMLSGTGDYQIVISGPIRDVRAAPGSDSQPGLRANQVLWAGFAPGKKVLASDVTLRPAPAAQFLPLRLRLDREPGSVALTVENVTTTPEMVYTGIVRPREIASLLDATRRASLAGVRVEAAYATFIGLVRVHKQPARIEAPLRVEGELRLAGGAPVPFARTVGDGRPLRFTVRARGSGVPRVRLRAWPAPVEKLLRPPRGRSWAQAVARRSLPPAFLLQRLLETRMRLVRVDQYQSYLANPDADGRNRTVYVYETRTAQPRRAAPAPEPGSGGSDGLVLAVAVAASVLGAGAALVVWAHS
jgi:hypothetical protein